MSDDSYGVNRIRSAGTGGDNPRQLLDDRPVMRLNARTIELKSIEDARNRTAVVAGAVSRVAQVALALINRLMSSMICGVNFIPCSQTRRSSPSGIARSSRPT